jgi:histidinol-phosphate aminotransferase
VALEALADETTFRARVREIVRERERLARAFAGVGCFEAIYPSEANFILVRCTRHEALHAYLAERRVVVRARHVPPVLPGGLRVTVGTPGENSRLITLLQQWKP